MDQQLFNLELNILIPQRAPFVLVDGIIAHESNKTTSVFKVDKDHILIEDGKLSAYGLIENMAQSAALMSGYEAHLSQLKPKTGFIGTITNAHIYDLPSIGEILMTQVIQTTQIMNIIVIECFCFCREIKIAECSMKIVLMEEV